MATAKKETEKKQEMTVPSVQSAYQPAITTITNTYVDSIRQQLEDRGVAFDEYSKQCVISSMGSIYSMIHNQGLTPQDLNGSNLQKILLTVAALKLNSDAYPRECYFQVRSVNVAKKGQKSIWEKQIEMGLEGDGNDALVAKFGRGVKIVHPYWLIRSGDEFSYGKRVGLSIEPPSWVPTGKGDIIRVVYPIEYVDGHVEYLVSERDDVLKNLYAHLSNNLMNETFGVCENRYDATSAQKKQIAEKKKAIMDKAKGLAGLDVILDDSELQQYISPAWSEPQSRESMIIRKMRNNVMKKVPKDFGNPVAAQEYRQLDDVVYQQVQEEISECANAEEFPISPEQMQTIEEKEAPKADVIGKKQEKASVSANKSQEPDWA